MSVLQQLNSPAIYLICGSVIVFVVAMCIVFMLKSYRAGLALGMDKTKLKRAVTSSITFTLLPSISILLGVVALSGSLGVPLPWLRLSVVGALPYETNVADMASKSIGLSGLNASEMTPQAFTTIALVMTIGIIWGLFCCIFLLKRYMKKVNGAEKKATKTKSGRNFGDVLTLAMFIGLVSAYLGSYIGQFTADKNIVPIITALVAAAVMGVFYYFTEKRKIAWLDNFSIAVSMLAGMAAAVIVSLV